MAKLTLDSPIIDLELNNKAFGSLNRRKITTIGLILAHTQEQLLEFRTLGLKNINIIKRKVHRDGLYFIDEEGYYKVLEESVKRKLGVQSLSIENINDSIRKKILELQIYEFVVLIPDYYRPTFNEYPYKYLKIKDIVNLNITATGDRIKDRKCISSNDAIPYVYAIGENASHWQNNEKGDAYKVWIKALHDFGFLFQDEIGYEELMTRIAESNDFQFNIPDYNELDNSQTIKDLSSEELQLEYQRLAKRLSAAINSKQQLLEEINKIEQQINLLERGISSLTRNMGVIDNVIQTRK